MYFGVSGKGLNVLRCRRRGARKPENRRFRLPHCCLTPTLQGTPANIRISLTFPESREIGLHLCCCYYVYIVIQIFVVGSERRMCFETECMRNGPSRSYKSLILAPTESAYATSYCKVINGNLDPILPLVQRYCRFPEKSVPPLFNPNF